MSDQVMIEIFIRRAAPVKTVRKIAYHFHDGSRPFGAETLFAPQTFSFPKRTADPSMTRD
jgi:hypothetical protein